LSKDYLTNWRKGSKGEVVEARRREKYTKRLISIKISPFINIAAQQMCISRVEQAA
jgi:hypothetical protein